MSDIAEILKMKPNFYALGGVSEAQIAEAEQQLGLEFSVEYREYVTAFGIASFGGKELTGICLSPRLNVVDVTAEQRNAFPTVPTDWYVIEEANIDGIVIWQSSLGEIYQTTPDMPPIKLCESLSEYIEF